MNQRFLILAVAIILSAVVIGSLVWLKDSNQPSEMAEPGKRASSNILSVNTAQPSGSALGATNTAPENSAAAQKLLKEMLQQKGIKEMPPLEKYLRDEIASGDKDRISRAFHDAIYSQYWPMSDVIPVLKGFLNYPDPFVRYLSAQDLMITGDNSAYATLLALIQSNAPIAGIGTDVRIQAAETLAQFRQTDAIPAILAAYQKTHNGNYMADLIKLQAGEVISIIETKGYFADPMAIQDYGQVGVQQYVPQLTSTFYNTQKTDLKEAAAWALATMTGNQDAINFLVQQVRLGLNDPSQTGSVNLRNAIQYLGALQSPQVKPVLESALSSSNSMVVQTAAVNLLFNQGGSDKVNQMVASELTGSSNSLGADMVLNLAPQLLNDPKVQAAGQNFSEHDGSGAWQRATVVRGSWPIYNWIDSYVIKLSK